jgi:cytochrome c biogenesis protein CcmG/thiol:disulfide interchange protein DsbE
MKTRMVLWIIPLVLFLAFAAFLMTRLGKDPAELPSVRVGKPFPAFNAPALLDAKPVTVADLTGKAAIVNVWASWCPSCKEEHPTLIKLAQQGVPIFGLNYKDDPQDAMAYLARFGNPFSLVISDLKGDIGLDLGVYGAPETYLIDDKAQVRYRYVGVFDETIWQTQLAPCYQQLIAGGDAPACQ